jgi:hypothetical protein
MRCKSEKQASREVFFLCTTICMLVHPSLSEVSMVLTTGCICSSIMTDPMSPPFSFLYFTFPGDPVRTALCYDGSCARRVCDLCHRLPRGSPANSDLKSKSLSSAASSSTSGAVHPPALPAHGRGGTPTALSRCCLPPSPLTPSNLVSAVPP